MKMQNKILQVMVFILAILSVLIIVVDSILINFYTEEIMLDPNTVSKWEAIIMLGALVMAGFYMASVLWVSQISSDKGPYSAGKVITIIFGTSCFLLLFLEKTLANSIGEMISTNMSYEAELTNLQMLFIVQFIYALLIMTEISAQDNEEISAEDYSSLEHSRDVIAAFSSIIPGLGHIYKAHYNVGFGLLFISPLFIWAGLVLGWATFGFGLFLPAMFVIFIGWHAYNIEDRRHHTIGLL